MLEDDFADLADAGEDNIPRQKTNCSDSMFEEHFADEGEDNIPRPTDVFIALETFLATGAYPDWSSNAKHAAVFLYAAA